MNCPYRYSLIQFQRGIMTRKKIFDGKLLKVYSSYKKLPDGKKGYFEEVEHPGASLVVPFYKNKIVFIRQFRPVIDKYIWELPAGILECGESPYRCAKREVEEETGYKVNKVKRLGKIYTSPGFCDEVIHIYRAECIALGKHNRETTEFIKLRHFSKRDVIRLLQNGKITDSKTIAALSLSGVACI